MIMDEMTRIFPPIDFCDLAARLKRPEGVVDIILDTDTYNEIDDQYALAYMVRSTESLNVRAITAAPFWSDPIRGRVQRSDSPADGMCKSYDEILKVLDLLERPDLKSVVYHGSESYLPGPFTPVRSEAAEKIIEISKEYTKERPLCIAAIGCVTNIASALLLDPTLRERIMVSWLGGHGHHFGTCNDFNMYQDIDAARILFGCGVPVIQLPLFGVVSEFRFGKAELEMLFRDKNKLCNYLIDNTYEFAKTKFSYEPWTKPLWDITVVAWFVNPDFFLSRIVPAPLPQHDETYSFLPDRMPLRYVYYVHKDPLTLDLMKKLSQ